MNVPSKDHQSPFLATTALEEFWDTSKPMLYLGEWCCRYSRKSFWEPLQGEIVPSPWQEYRRLQEAYHYCVDLCEELLPKLGHALNQIHGTDHGARYWRIVLGPWLNLYIPVLYDRYESIQCALAAYPKLTTLVLPESAFETLPDTSAFFWEIQQDRYNLQMYSKILKFMCKRFPELQTGPGPSESSSDESHVAAQSWSYRFIMDVAGIVSKAFKRGRPVILRTALFSPSFLLLLLITTRFRLWPIFTPWTEFPSLKEDRAARSLLANLIDGKDDFHRLINTLLATDLPKCYVEGFEEVIRAASRDYPSRANAIVSSSAWYYDETFKQWAASCAEQGTVLIGLQHGGNYGSLQLHIDPCHEITISDHYFSWGWEDHSRKGKVSPAPTPILAGRDPIGADNGRTGILLTTTIWPRYLMQFPFHPTQFSTYLSWQFYFISALDPSYIPALRVRLHRWQLGWDRTQMWNDHYPEVTLEDHSTPFLSSLTKCRLYVADHLSTTFLEALSANKPTVLFWHPELVDLRQEARPYYDQLRAAGILHNSPAAAAKAVSIAYPDVETWWNDPERQSAVRAFCYRFARTSPTAMDDWAKTLDRFSKRSSR